MRQKAFGGSAVKLAVAALLVWAVLGLMGCYYMPGVARPGGTARASIGVSKSIPAGTMSVVLIVGGPGMDTIANTYPVGTTTATLTVPSGSARTFTLLANTPSVTFRDDVTVDLTPGETKSIVLNPVLATSQIIAPDYFNGRLVQIADMGGTGWTTLTDATNGLGPYDVDFDDQGHIYIADAYRGLLTTPDITVTPVLVAGVASQSVYSIGMDRARGLLYYVGYVVASGAYELHSIKVTPSLGTDTKINLAALSVTLNYDTSVAADPQGFVYLTNTSTAQVLKIDPTVPTAPSVAASYSDASLYYPWDVLVKGDYVYVSDNSDPKVIRLSRSLQFVDSLRGPDSDPFHGPERFVAILNKPITVVDERQYAPGDRLVAFADMTGAGWTTFGSSGFGQDQFEFFYSSSIGS